MAASVIIELGLPPTAAALEAYLELLERREPAISAEARQILGVPALRRPGS